MRDCDLLTEGLLQQTRMQTQQAGDALRYSSMRPLTP